MIYNMVYDNPHIKVMWYIRLANLAIDAAAIFLIVLILGVFAGLLALAGINGPMNFITEVGPFADRVVTALILILYYSILEGTTQRTLGKIITGTIVVTESGAKPAFQSILGRSFCRIFWIEMLSFVAEQPRGWHDSASGTYVVNAKKLKEIIALENDFGQIGTPVEDNTNQWGL